MKIAIVTGSRADWNGLGMVAKALRPAADVRIITCGQHSDMPESRAVINGDGFDYSMIHMPSGNLAIDTVECASIGLAALGHVWTQLKPDLVLLAGDRYEILSAAFSAAMMNIPIAHIAGGDITEGSIDNKLRNAITALSDLHLVTNAAAYHRLLEHGPRPPVLTGSPAIDRIEKRERVSRETFLNQMRSIGLSPRALNILVSYHAPTLELDPVIGCVEMLSALEHIANKTDAAFILIGSNADAFGRTIDELLLGFAGAYRLRSAFVANLPPNIFYSALDHCNLMIGNSSAALYEAPSFGLPVVNIGRRQLGRMTAANVFTVDPPTAGAIADAAALQLRVGKCDPCRNPYGDGFAAERIAFQVFKFLGIRGIA